MGDLISREFLKTAIHNFFYGLNHAPTEEDIQAYIEAAPSVENKGEWERVSAERYVVSAKYRYRCSKCGGIVIGEFNFCPNCGADMRGVSE